MPKQYKDIYDQLIKNSRRNGKCIESTFKKDSHRPPMMTHKGKLISVHRACWQYHHGQIPKDMFVCHHCDNPKCFRIEHLFLGTASDNMQDMIKKRRDNIFGARKYSLSDWEKAEELRKEGYSSFDISKMTGIKYAAVAAHMVRHKIIKGTAKSKPKKFPIEIITTIYQMIANGWNDKDIYEHLGMSESTFYRRLNNKLS